jgi:phosphoserine aminotransferase
MSRSYNFNAGPAVLPDSVLEQIRDELFEWQGSGASVMEVSHRSAEFKALAEDSEARLRRLMNIPDHYRVLFLQGGAQAQFSAVPMNLLGQVGKADYIDTGVWSGKAIAEARRYGEVNVVASSESSNYTHIPAPQDWQLDPQAAYVYYTPNETISGVEFSYVPSTGQVPLVADMTSSFLSQEIKLDGFGVIFAGAQKNAGIAGLTLVIVRDDLLDQASPHTPLIMNYARQAEEGSMLNTAPTFAWYVADLIFKWLESEGGVEVIAERNQRKAEALYSCVDASNYYTNPISVDCRSIMNVPFVLADSSRDADFLRRAAEAGLVGLKGHRSVGGMRASLYNAMPYSGVESLIDFMRDFEQHHA